MHLKTNVFFLLHGLKSEYIGVYKEANKNHPRTTVAHQLVPFWVCVDQCTGTAPARPALALRAFSCSPKWLSKFDSESRIFCCLVRS